MAEPQRIGLTQSANQQLDEMLESLNAENQGNALIKKDLYRLAIALGLKEKMKAPPISEKTEGFLRVSELDEDKGLFIAVDASGLCNSEEPVYAAMERLAEQGIRDFYTAYKTNMDQLPWDKILKR